MIKISDLHWAAGFLDAEGCFHFSKSGHLIASAGQVNGEPVGRLLSLFGGSVSLSVSKNDKNGHMHRWSLVHSKAATLMMTLFSLLSPKRQKEIKIALTEWKSRKPAGQFRSNCVRGHELSGDNLYVHRGKRYCRECRSYKVQIENGWRQPKWENRDPGEKMNHHCKYGHPYEGDNIYIWNGKRYCRACRTHAVAIQRGWKQKSEVSNVL